MTTESKNKFKIGVTNVHTKNSLTSCLKSIQR